MWKSIKKFLCGIVIGILGSFIFRRIFLRNRDTTTSFGDEQSRAEDANRDIKSVSDNIAAISGSNDEILSKIRKQSISVQNINNSARRITDNKSNKE